MAERCSHCGSADVVALGQAYSCLGCGQQTEYVGQAETRTVGNGGEYYTDPPAYHGATLAPKPEPKKARAKKAS